MAQAVPLFCIDFPKVAKKWPKNNQKWLKVAKNSQSRQKYTVKYDTGPKFEYKSVKSVNISLKFWSNRLNIVFTGFLMEITQYFHIYTVFPQLITAHE